ncbi:MAG: hypothetical protein RTU30_15180 [Candidatus Thorarchaeota archaeon]
MAFSDDQDEFGSKQPEEYSGPLSGYRNEIILVMVLDSASGCVLSLASAFYVIIQLITGNLFAFILSCLLLPIAIIQFILTVVIYMKKTWAFKVSLLTSIVAVITSVVLLVVGTMPIFYFALYLIGAIGINILIVIFVIRYEKSQVQDN